MSPQTNLIMYIVAFSAVTTTIIAGVSVFLMWIFGRFVSRWAAMAIGTLATAAIVFTVVVIYWECGASPILGRGPSSEGVPHYQCDDFAGAMSLILMWIVGPISGALILAATAFQYLLLRRQGAERVVSYGRNFRSPDHTSGD